MNPIRFIWNLVSPATPARLVLMRSQHPSRVLLFARELIKDRCRWTTGVEARMLSGSEVNVNDERATCFCANGAISACAVDEMTADAARMMLAGAIFGAIPPEHDEREFIAYRLIVQLNDKQGHSATIAALDKALR